MPSSTATSGRSLRVARSIDYGYQPYDRLLDHEPNDNHQGEDEQDDFYDEYYIYDTSGIDRPSQKVIWVWSLLVTVFSIANIAVYAVLIHRAISIHSPVIKHWSVPSCPPPTPSSSAITSTNTRLQGQFHAPGVPVLVSHLGYHMVLHDMVQSRLLLPRLRDTRTLTASRLDILRIVFHGPFWSWHGCF
jgi:hypothetical protein